jgi:hypothetical protein
MLDELERCREWIEAALEYSGGTHNFDDVVEGLKSGVLQLWPTPRGCIVTEIVLYPRKRVLNVFLGGGELDQILDMHTDVVDWAKAQGCTALTMSGRAGWKKSVAPHGWKPQHSTYVKEFG